MQNYQCEFIEFVLQHKALRFGEFKLKSGRISPYFFNIGIFHDGEALAKLGQYYADAIEHAKLQYDVLFGPAYKGIPLVCTTSIALAKYHHHNMPYCFNRKESKDHGEGGNIVGAALQGRILIIDDVITAGTAIRESMQLINANNAKLAGIVVALDRQERGQEETSAIAQIERTYKTKVISIITLENILQYLNQHQELEIEKRLLSYREQYGCKS